MSVKVFTFTQKVRTRHGGVFTVRVVPADSRYLMSLLGEASPDKWGRLYSRQL